MPQKKSENPSPGQTPKHAVSLPMRAPAQQSMEIPDPPKPGAPKKKKRKPKEKRLFHKPVTVKKVLIWLLLAVLLAAVIIGGRFIYRTVINPISAFDNTPQNTPVLTTGQTAAVADPGATPGPTFTWTPVVTYSPAEILAMQADRDFMHSRVNILLTGIDYAPERESRTTFRTDTMMLICIDFETGRGEILSIPRDSYADIAYTDHKWKINGAFMSAGGAEGNGFACMMQSVSDCIGGIPVDYYMAVEMQAVKDIVDILGGVWYDVDYEINMNGRHLDKGYQLLDGQAVLDYMRARKGITSGTDIDRIDRQQRLLMEVFNQMKSASLLHEIPSIYNAMKSQIYTNLNFEQIVALALFALDFDLETESQRYTLKGEYMQAYNATYYVLDHEYTESIIREIFGVKAQIDWAYSIGFVQYDVAREDLNDAILKLEDLLFSHQAYFASVLTPEEQLAVSDQLAAAKLLQETVVLALETPQRSYPEEDVELVVTTTEELQQLSETLTDLVNNPPTPTPSPTPSPTPTPTPEPTP